MISDKLSNINLYFDRKELLHSYDSTSIHRRIFNRDKIFHDGFDKEMKSF